jgi:membrane protein required for colicin V production
MNTVDLAVLGVIVLSGLFSFIRGFVREVLSLVAWVGAAAAAVMFEPYVRPMVSRYVPAPEWTEPVGYFVIFIVSLVILSIIARIIGGAVRSSALGGIDRGLGLLFGLARGAGLAILAYIIAGMAIPIEHWPKPVLEARTLPFIYGGAAWVARQIPPEYQPSVPIHAPPGRQAELEGILSVTPTGRATDPPHKQVTGTPPNG